MIQQERWLNSSGVSNKDYVITYNEADFVVVSEWGRVGGARKTRREMCVGSAEMRELVEAKRSRRKAHGYWLASTAAWDDTVAEFVGDEAAIPHRRRMRHERSFSSDFAELV